MKRNPYNGHKRKLLIAFDVGTTYSGVSYSILDPGKVPQIYSVNRFPGLNDVKIPSIMYYDRSGHVCVIGGEAEADSGGIEERTKLGWVGIKWFKMHYRPNHSSSPLPPNNPIPPLPPGKSILDILADFLHYLNTCTKQYIRDSHPGIGAKFWDTNSESATAEIEYILSLPNRWDGPPQGLMRRAAEKAGLTISGGKNENTKVSFISEGEASLNMCIEHDLLDDSVRKGAGLIVVDAGGGTIDFSAYALDKKFKGSFFEEIVEPQSHFQGSEFVTERLGVYLKDLLKGSRYEERIPIIKNIFNKNTKHMFRDSSDLCPIHFGNLKDKDSRVGIIRGKFCLEGSTVASFFKPAVECIVDTVCEMRRNSRKPIHSVFLVGGFANNEYLFNQVKNSLSEYGLRVRKPNTQTNKAVANGAITHALDNRVRSRVMYRAYGVECNIVYDPKFADHVRRKSRCITLLSGEKVIPNGFHLLVAKREKLSTTQELTCEYVRTAQNVNELREIKKDVFFYQGNLPREEYKWMDNDLGALSLLCRAKKVLIYIYIDGFHKYCTIQTTLPDLPATSLSPIRGKSPYFKIQVKIVLLFGGTELKAQVAWKGSSGQERRQDADIVYDNNLNVSSNTPHIFSWGNKPKSTANPSTTNPLSTNTHQDPHDFPPLSLLPSLSLTSTTSPQSSVPPFSPTTSDQILFADSDRYSETHSSSVQGWEDYVTDENDSETEYGTGVWAFRRDSNSTATTASHAPATGIPMWKGGRRKLGKRVL